MHHAEAIDSGTQLTPQGGQHHTYLLMSHPASSETKVLETGEELSEVPADRCGFVLDSPTIAAGNVLNNSLIVQASAVLAALRCAALYCAVLCWAGLGWAGLGWAKLDCGQVLRHTPATYLCAFFMSFVSHPLINLANHALGAQHG